MDNRQFTLGKLFSSGQVFRNVVRKYAILNQKAVRVKKNNLAHRIKCYVKRVVHGKCMLVNNKGLNHFKLSH